MNVKPPSINAMDPGSGVTNSGAVNVPLPDTVPVTSPSRPMPEAEPLTPANSPVPAVNVSVCVYGPVPSGELEKTPKRPPGSCAKRSAARAVQRHGPQPVGHDDERIRARSSTSRVTGGCRK
jgi:hypothetical protein